MNNFFNLLTQFNAENQQTITVSSIKGNWI